MNELLLESVSRERLERWVSDSYAIACDKGFHEKELSKKHFLMLVLSELGEVVKADRKGLHPKLQGDALENTLRFNDYTSTFEVFVKDSVEDELADVCIRLFDFCGAFGIELDVVYDEEMRLTWKEMFGEQSLCENCFELCNLVCDIDEGDECEGIGCVLSFIFCMCYHMGICLDEHIDLKMVYNRHREPLHGKKY